MEKLVLHNIITCNISETSHAYTYIKRKTRDNDKRVDMTFLKVKYQNPAMQDMYIHEEKQILENISYKSERSMKFEIFSGKFHNAVNVLETYGPGIYNEDIVDMMWQKLHSTDLSMFVSSLKVDSRRNRQKYTNILQ